MIKAGSCVAVLLVFVFFGAAQPLTTQGGFPSKEKLSTLSGRVFDRNGAVVVGSEVSLGGYRGSKYKTLTNDEGIYLFELPAGLYSVQIRANGFSMFSLDCYQIPTEGRMNLDVTLQVNGESGCMLGPNKEGRQTQRGAKKKKTIVIE